MKNGPEKKSIADSTGEKVSKEKCEEQTGEKKALRIPPGKKFHRRKMHRGKMTGEKASNLNSPEKKAPGKNFTGENFDIIKVFAVFSIFTGEIDKITDSYSTRVFQ